MIVFELGWVGNEEFHTIVEFPWLLLFACGGRGERERDRQRERDRERERDGENKNVVMMLCKHTMYRT